MSRIEFCDREFGVISQRINRLHLLQHLTLRIDPISSFHLLAQVVHLLVPSFHLLAKPSCIIDHLIEQKGALICLFLRRIRM